MWKTGSGWPAVRTASTSKGSRGQAPTGARLGSRAGPPLWRHQLGAVPGGRGCAGLWLFGHRLSGSSEFQTRCSRPTGHLHTVEGGAVGGSLSMGPSNPRIAGSVSCHPSARLSSRLGASGDGCPRARMQLTHPCLSMLSAVPGAPRPGPHPGRWGCRWGRLGGGGTASPGGGPSPS